MVRMSLAQITREAVLAAVAEHDELGQQRFLATYGFKAATKYRLSYNDALYDSKAIVGVAHRHATGAPLAASEFSGGAPVISTLSRLGFQVVEIHPETGQQQTSSSELLVGFNELRVHAETNGTSASYQYVVVLWAISRVRAGLPRMVPFADVDAELKRVLRPFALRTSAPDPANPWTALTSMPWWEFGDPYRGRTVRYKQVRALNVAAGFTAQVYDRIRAEPQLAADTVDVIAQIIGDHDAVPALLEALALTSLHGTGHRSDPNARVALVSLESSHTERFTVTDTAEATVVERHRREARLQADYVAHLRRLGHTVSRHRIVLPNGEGELVTDIYDETAGELIEVKAGTDRPTIRLALGQILDYARYATPSASALLVPHQPTDELIALLHAFGISVIWPSAEAFERQSPVVVNATS